VISDFRRNVNETCARLSYYGRTPKIPWLLHSGKGDR